MGTQIEWGRTIQNWSELGVGSFLQRTDADLVTGTLAFSEGDYYGSMGLSIRYRADTLDDRRFPLRGSLLDASFVQGLETLGLLKRLEVESTKVWSYGRHHFVGLAIIGSTFNKTVGFTEQVSLGGFGRMSGLDDDPLRGRHSVLLGGRYLYELGDFPSMAKVYLGASVEQGNVWQSDSEISLGNTLTSGSLFVAMNTALGPLYVGMGHTEGYDTRFLMQLG